MTVTLTSYYPTSAVAVAQAEVVVVVVVVVVVTSYQVHAKIV